MLGKEIRLKRLIPGEDGKYFGLTVDHAIARGVMPGLDTIDDTLKKMVAGGPNAITMHKGIAEKCFAREDVQVADVEEALVMGADAVSVGCIVGGDNQKEQLAMLGRISKDAYRYGMPLVSHIYPRGNHIEGTDQYKTENVIYAARAAAELGVDLVKTNYTGSVESFAKVVKAVPTRVAIAGGFSCKSAIEYIQMTRDVMDAGAAGVTYGRFVFSYPHITALVETLSRVIHEGISAAEARQYLEYLENETAGR